MSSFTLWMITINTSFWLICCFGLAVLVRFIPRYLLEKSTWYFKEYRFEKKLYKHIKVNKWKDLLPEYGGVFNFQKKHLSNKLDADYINRFILETYYAELGHLSKGLLGFICVLINPIGYKDMALLCAIINLLVQLPFCLIQRFNRPRLIKLMSRLVINK